MIELKIDEFKNGIVTFHISRQDEEDYKRLQTESFKSKLSDGKEYFLISGIYPQYYELHREFFVRGTNSEIDNAKIIVTFTEFLKIFELLQSYHKIS